MLDPPHAANITVVSVWKVILSNNRFVCRIYLFPVTLNWLQPDSLLYIFLKRRALLVLVIRDRLQRSADSF